MSTRVRVLGCVTKMGPIILRTLQTVGAAIKAAGGFRFDDDFAPTGVVAVRSMRHSDGKYYCGRRLNYVRSPQQARSFLLLEGDQIIVQYGAGRKQSILSPGRLSKKWKNG